MSKEIYKEYLCEWVDKKNAQERVELNQAYILGAKQFLSILHSRGLEAGTVLVLHEQHHNQIKRKPKTQMINGHEVVAPRYDIPTNKDELIFTLSPLELCGFDDVAWDFLDDHQKKAILKYGWFDNSDDAEDYANAHRENKND